MLSPTPPLKDLLKSQLCNIHVIIIHYIYDISKASKQRKSLAKAALSYYQ